MQALTAYPYIAREIEESMHLPGILRGSFLIVRSLFWTVIGPGTVTLVIPYLIVTRRRPAAIDAWGPVQITSLIPIGIGAGILLYCIWNFAVEGRGTLSPFDAPKRLVVRGPYRYVRNPMYVGVLLILLGEAALFESIGLVGYTLAWFVVINVVIVAYEEPALRSQFGDTYEQYRRDVGRWIPRKPGFQYPEHPSPESV